MTRLKSICQTFLFPYMCLLRLDIKLLFYYFKKKSEMHTENSNFIPLK